MRYLIIYLRVFKALLLRLQSQLRLQIRCQRWREKGVAVSDNAVIRLGPQAVLEIGSGSSVGDYTILDLTDDPNCLPGDENVSSRLIIGQRTAINEFNNIRAAGGTIEIGDNCLISQFVSIVASNHSIDVPGAIRDLPWDRDSNWVRIEDGVWIGTHAVILPGVRVGRDSIIAAGAVVTRDVPAYAIVAGIPAEVKRLRDCASTQAKPA